jgi:biopolymer transport protein ExbD
MSLKKTTRRGHGTLNELNITPLLDLVFVLLVIFIITTPQLVNNLEMFLPSGKPPPADPNAPKPNIHRITVDAQGQILLNDEPVTVTQLHDTLKLRKQADPGLGIVVKGSDDADYQHIVSVLDVLQQLEITKVGLATAAPDP